MPSVINTNIASLNAQRNLGTSQTSLATSLQRLSSGLRINSAKDDAAGLAISARMTAQINGLNQAARNANDGISLAQTAEGALGQISDNLQRMRELAVQAANGSNSSSDRTAIQAEISQLQQEITRVANNTQFNGTNLLDGTLNNAQFQVGANANQTINAAVGSAKASDVGTYKITTSNTSSLGVARLGSVTNTFTAFGNSTAASAQTLTINGNGTTATTAASASSASTTIGTIAGSAAQFAQLVNAKTSTTGVTAVASTTLTLGAFSAAGAVSITLYGAPTAAGAANGVTISASMQSTTDVTGFASAINGQTASTGITAVADTTAGTITLTQSSGYDIALKNGSAATFSATGSLVGTVVVGATGAATNSVDVGGTLTFNSPNSYTVASNIAAAAGSLFNVAAAAANASTLNAVSTLDVTTLTNGIPTGANSALDVIDGALSAINSSRASLGAIQNRFSSVVTNLQTTAENLSASRSRIQDTDFAAETANLTRSQILQQAGTAMLAQANALPNTVLTLLK